VQGGKMNKVIMSGNICNDLELKVNGDVKSLGVRLAVRRSFKTNGQYQSDFISMTAFDKTADLLSQYSHKGDTIMVVGRLQNCNYQKQDGSTVYQDKVIIESVEFLGKREEEKPSQETKQPSKKVAKQENKGKAFDDDFKDITEDDLPF
jgi:single-strand DNA-binding protein